ncbi:hypothetical protein Hanom_Chr05g00453261 [Helianthus anomalus]
MRLKYPHLFKTVEPNTYMTSEFRDEIPFNLGMMWYLRKTHSHLNLSSRSSVTAYQISGRNFFQLGDDMTTRSSRLIL